MPSKKRKSSQEEIKAYSSGAVKIPPKEEFIASCERFHDQISGEVGVLENCLTLAQLIAENEKLRQRAEAAEAKLGAVEEVVKELADPMKWNWTKGTSGRNAADSALAVMAHFGLIEYQEHPSGGNVWKINGNFYGRTDSLHPQKASE